MDIVVNTLEQATVVAITGDIDGKSAPQIQERITPLVQPGCKIILDLSGVAYMSSAGLRVILSTHRQTVSKQAQLALVGVAPDIQETMAATGFIDFFKIYDTLENCLAG